jgi:hypothetical protein
MSSVMLQLSKNKRGNGATFEVKDGTTTVRLA